MRSVGHDSGVLSAVAGGHDEMRGEHRSQLPLSLAGDGRLRLWTLSEGRGVIPPQREVKDLTGTAQTTTSTPALRHPLLWITFTQILH